VKKRLFRNDPSSRYLWSLLWGQPKSAAEAYWPRAGWEASRGWWLRGWGGRSSSSSSSSARCRLRRHRRPRVPLFLTQFRCNIYTLPISRNQISHPFVAWTQHSFLHSHAFHLALSFLLPQDLSIYLSLIIWFLCFLALGFWSPEFNLHSGSNLGGSFGSLCVSFVVNLKSSAEFVRVLNSLVQLSSKPSSICVGFWQC
jgi:hypothetical protein